jgi:hypothetical protein
MRISKTSFAVLAALAAVASPSFSQEAPSARAKWEKALVRLEQADAESIAAVNESLADVSGSFDAASKNVRPFVDDLLGIYGKIHYAKALPGKISGYGFSLVNYVFGSTYESPLAVDDFEKHARETFTAKVFDPDVFKRGVSGGVDAYVARLKEIEGRLLVDLQADVEDPEMQIPAIHAPKLAEELLEQVDVGVELSVAEAASDFGFTVAKECVSYWGGNVASGVLLASTAAGVKAADPTNDPFSATAFLGGALVGYGVSYAVDKAVEAAGYDPAGRLAGRVEAMLRRSQQGVFEGRDAEKSSLYVWFTLLRRAAVYESSRDIYGLAADKLAATTYLGLRPTLTALHGERLCIRRRLVWESIFGVGSAMPTAELLTPRQIEESENLLAKAVRTVWPE